MSNLGMLFKEALENTLKASETQAAIFDYSDRADFQKLWASEKGVPVPKVLMNELNGKKAAIIVWSGFPLTKNDSDDNVPAGSNNDGKAEKLLEPHLTPLDWALAFSIAVQNKQNKIEPLPDLRIHIVDLTSKRYENAWAIRMRHQLLADIPWVSLHAPLFPLSGDAPAYREAYGPILEGAGLADGKWPLVKKDGGAWKLVQAGKSLSKGASPQRRKNLKDLANQWAATLTQSDDHHDVNNIIGPDILAKPDRRRGGIFGALLRRLEWSGRDLKAAADWEEWNTASLETKLFGRALSVYVVDDHLQQGWGRFLCRLFGYKFHDKSILNNGWTRLNADGIEMWGCQNPLPLIEFLKKKAIFGRRDYKAQLIGKKKDTRPELIFLDLRLHATISEAREHVRQLLVVIQTKLPGGLAWPTIEQSEIARIENWCEGKTEDARIADEALLLLPRLLALALPLTPIILFSSTSKAWIRDRLKPYQNIFTGFEKPRVLSDPASIEASISALRDGLNKAVGMMRLRLQLAHAQRAIEIAESQRPNNAQRLTRGYVEIYGDETRTVEEGITSGLAVCIFPDSAYAEAIQTRLCQEHRAVGVVWAKRPGQASPVLQKGAAISKNDARCATQTQLLADLLTSCPLPTTPNERALWSVVATRVSPSPVSKGPPSLAAFPDGQLDVALRFNLEFALYALLQYYCAEADISHVIIDLHLPTRVVPNSDETFAKELCAAFDLGSPDEGIDRSTGERIWFIPTASLGSRGASSFPLIRGWLHGSASSGLASNIRKIKTTNLSKGTDKGITGEQASSRRLFHDIADWACTASGKLHDVENNTWGWPLKDHLTEQKLFTKWFVCTDGERYREGSVTKYRFEDDSANALKLMSALRASFQGSPDDKSENDALRMILRNTYIGACADRLIENDYCAQQRVILWMLRHELSYAKGKSLHALLPADMPTVSKTRSAASAANAEEASRVVSSLPNASPTAEPQAAFASQNDSAPLAEGSTTQGDNQDQNGCAVIDDRESRGEAMPSLLDEAELFSKYPECRVYEVVRRTKHGDIFFKDAGAAESEMGTHWTNDIALASQFNGEGWGDPITVLGQEIEGPADDPYEGFMWREKKALRIIAAKLTNGRWQLLS